MSPPASRRAEDFLELVERAKRGRLKLYIGFAAGVGKTYRMLEEARALKKRGVDVVVGFVETHGRAETAALIEGVEVVPRREVAYRALRAAAPGIAFTIGFWGASEGRMVIPQMCWVIIPLVFVIARLIRGRPAKQGAVAAVETAAGTEPGVAAS